jgi:hypothetical protein
MGELTAGRVIFGPNDADPILGITALESVGITVDLANRTLKRLPALPLKVDRDRFQVATERVIDAKKNGSQASVLKNVANSLPTYRR